MRLGTALLALLVGITINSAEAGFDTHEVNPLGSLSRINGILCTNSGEVVAIGSYDRKWQVAYSFGGVSNWQKIDDFSVDYGGDSQSEAISIAEGYNGTLHVLGTVHTETGRQSWAIRSTSDFGKTWTTTHKESVHNSAPTLFAASTEDRSLYAIEREIFGAHSLLISRDGGFSWTKVSLTRTGKQAFYPDQLQVARGKVWISGIAKDCPDCEYHAQIETRKLDGTLLDRRVVPTDRLPVVSSRIALSTRSGHLRIYGAQTYRQKDNSLTCSVVQWSEDEGSSWTIEDQRCYGKVTPSSVQVAGIATGYFSNGKVELAVLSTELVGQKGSWHTRASYTEPNGAHYSLKSVDMVEDSPGIMFSQVCIAGDRFVITAGQRLSGSHFIRSTSL